MRTTLIGAVAFLVMMAVLRYLFQLGVDAAAWVVGLTAVVAWSAALLVRRKPWFHKEQVDLIYYSVAILGVLVYFVQERAIRAERAVDERIEGLQQDVESYPEILEAFDAETLRLARLENARAERRQQIIAQWELVVSQVHETLVDATVTATTADVLICAEASALPGTYAHELRESDIPRLDEFAWPEQATKDCTSALERLRAQRDAALEQPFDLDAFLNDPRRVSIIENRRISLDGEAITVGDLARLVSNEPLAVDRAAERERIEVSLSHANAALVTARQNRAKDKEAARDQVWPIAWNLRYRDWPYVLIWLLTLKLARYGPPLLGGSERWDPRVSAPAASTLPSGQRL